MTYFAAQQTVARVAAVRSLGFAQRRNRVPRARLPTLIESDYAARLVAIVARLRAVTTRLIPESAASVRADAAHARGDESAAAQGRRAMERVRSEIEDAINVTQLESIAHEMARRTSAHQHGDIMRQARAALGVDVMLLDPKVAPIVEGFVHENVALIKSLKNRALDDLENIVARAYATGTRAEAVAPEIAARYQMAERHARLIARDQIGKLNGRITAARHRELGITSFVWRTMNDRKVRPRHRTLNGQRFTYEQPPHDGLPGIPIACRCTQEPVFDDLLEMVLAQPAAARPAAAPLGVLTQARPRRRLSAVVRRPSPAPVPSPSPVPRPARPRPIQPAPPSPAAAASPPPPAPRAPPAPSAATFPAPVAARASVTLPPGASDAAGIAALRQRTIISTRALGGGVNTTAVATLDDGSQAVWKPVTGEHPRLRTNIPAGSYYVREAAAANVASQLGVADLLPATVTTRYRRTRGSLQIFVGNAQSLIGSAVPAFDRDAAERMRVFDFIVGNTDRHRGNVLQVTRSGRSMPVLIDHGLCFPRGVPDRFIQPWDNIPQSVGSLLESTLALIRNIDLDELAKTLLDSGLDERAVTFTLYRTRILQMRPDLLDIPHAPSGARTWEHTKTAHVSLTQVERDRLADIVARHKKP